MSPSTVKNHVITTIPAIMERATATAKEVGITPVEALRLEAEGLIKRAGVRHVENRGRPAVEWRATDKARKRAKRAAAAA